MTAFIYYNHRIELLERLVFDSIDNDLACGDFVEYAIDELRRDIKTANFKGQLTNYQAKKLMLRISEEFA